MPPSARAWVPAIGVDSAARGGSSGGMSDPSTHPLLAYAKPSNRVRIASKRRLNVHVTGSGTPPILLLNGLGGTNLSWFRVQRALSAETTVV